MHGWALVILEKNKTNENNSNNPDPSKINFQIPNHASRAVTTTNSDIPTDHLHVALFGSL